MDFNKIDTWLKSVDGVHLESHMGYNLIRGHQNSMTITRDLSIQCVAKLRVKSWRRGREHRQEPYCLFDRYKRKS